jgi:UDP-N-acetylmuramoyl-L-alanyl-D-glutamate--2,6-diaminopimelate ligase
VLVTPIGEVTIQSRLTGRHNVSNWLAAAAVALGWGIDLEAVAEAASFTDAPLGRMQRVQRGQPFEVVVDFAHTPNALETTLTTLRKLSEGKLLLVFGMAGGRDAANRPVMGGIAARSADFFVISTDDPMHEDPAAIAEEVAAGARGAGATEGQSFMIELDRRAAVREVLRRARPGDTVLLAGKGHERRMLIGDRAEPWSDEGAVNDILSELG